jgi:hypothetical protein
VVATGGNQQQIGPLSKTAKTSDIRCQRLPPVA